MLHMMQIYLVPARRHLGIIPVAWQIHGLLKVLHSIE